MPIENCGVVPFEVDLLFSPASLFLSSSLQDEVAASAGLSWAISIITSLAERDVSGSTLRCNGFLVIFSVVSSSSSLEENSVEPSLSVVSSSSSDSPQE